MSEESFERKPRVYRRPSATARFEPADPLVGSAPQEAKRTRESAYPAWEHVVKSAKVVDDLVRIGAVGYIGIKSTIALGMMAVSLPSLLKERARQERENGGSLPYCEDLASAQSGEQMQFCRIDWRRTGFGMLYDWARGEDGSVSTRLSVGDGKQDGGIRIVIPEEHVKRLEEIMAPDPVSTPDGWSTEVRREMEEPASRNVSEQARHRRRLGR